MSAFTHCRFLFFHMFYFWHSNLFFREANEKCIHITRDFNESLHALPFSLFFHWPFVFHFFSPAKTKGLFFCHSSGKKKSESARMYLITSRVSQRRLLGGVRERERRNGGANEGKRGRAMVSECVCV